MLSVMWRVLALALILVAAAAAGEPLVSGTLVDARGTAVEGATISVVPLDPAWHPRPRPKGALPLDAPLAVATTTDEGGFRLDAPAGDVVVAISAPGRPTMLRWRERVHVEAGKPATLKLRMPDLAKVHGIVLDESGKPIAGMPLAAWSDGDDGAAMIGVTSDAAGRFALAVPRGCVLTMVGESAERFGIVRFRVDDEDVPAALHVGRADTVAGTLVSSRTFRPLAGVEIRAFAPTIPPPRSAGDETEGTVTSDAEPTSRVVSGADGRFSIVVPHQGFAVAAGALGRLALVNGRNLLDDAPGHGVKDDDAEPRPTYPGQRERLMRIQCRDEQGRPVEGALASVGWFGNEVQPVGATGSDGVAVLRTMTSRTADLNQVALYVERPGHSPAWIPWLTPGAGITSILLPRAANLSGIVRDAAGNPVTGARLEAGRTRTRTTAGEAWDGSRPVLTGADGAYLLRDLAPGLHRVKVTAPGLLTPPVPRVTLVAGREARLDLVMPRGATLRGRVRDAAGPVAGATIDVADHEPYDSMIQQEKPPPSAVTQADGTFAVEGLDPDTWYFITADDPWHAEASSGGKPSESLIEIALTPTGSIAGELAGIVESTRVNCSREDNDSAAGTWSTEASFLIEDLAAAEYECRAEGKRSRSEPEKAIVREGAATPMTLRVTADPTLFVRVLDARTREPLHGAQVAECSDRTDEKGRCLAGMPAEDDEDPSVVAGAHGYVGKTEKLERPLPVSITILLEPAPRVRGVVVDAAGVPVEGVDVGWEDDIEVVATDERGEFEMILGDDDDDARIVAWRAIAGAMEEGEAALGRPRDSPVRIVLKRVETATLVVLVRDGGGPVADADLYIAGPKHSTGTTDSEGRFEASGLHPGKYTVSLEAVGDRPRVARERKLEAGSRVELVLEAAGGWSVEGRIVREGAPVGGMMVGGYASDASSDAPFDFPPHFVDPGSVIEDVASDADGSFRIGPFPESATTARVTVHPPNESDGGWWGRGPELSRSVEVAKGEGPVVIDLAEVTAIGRVVDAGGPVPEAWVGATCEHEGVSPNTRTLDDGSFRLEKVPVHADCELLIDTVERGSMRRRISTPETGVLDLGELRLLGQQVRGHAAGLDGSFADLMMFHWRAADGSDHGEVVLDPDSRGNFVATLPLFPIDWFANSKRPEFGWVTGRFEPGQPLDIALPKGASLSVVIRGSRDTGIVANLRHWNDHASDEALDWALDVETPRPGVLELRGLAAGHVVIDVQTDEGDLVLEEDTRTGESRRLEVDLP